MAKSSSKKKTRQATKATSHKKTKPGAQTKAGTRTEASAKLVVENRSEDSAETTAGTKTKNSVQPKAAKKAELKSEPVNEIKRKSRETEEYPEASIQQQVFDLGFDLKAETFTAHLLEDEVDMDIHLSDYFKRRFSKDITQIIDGKDGEKLKVHLSRRSFYNIFPERFFHTSYSGTPYVENMVADYKNRKIEEEQVRKFFKPLEAEFFLQRVAIETEEDKTFQSLGSPELVDFLTDLWEIDAKVPEKMAAKILKTMPFMYKIAGNLALLQKILENVIEEQIEIGQGFASIGHQAEDAPWQLGVNMATAGNPQTFLPKYRFTIKDVRRPDAIGDYLPGGKIASVVAFFLEHTLPYESDYEIDFTVAEPKTKFLLDETAYSGRLGISATI